MSERVEEWKMSEKWNWVSLTDRGNESKKFYKSNTLDKQNFKQELQDTRKLRSFKKLKF